MNQKIYLDNNATTQIDEKVFNAMLPYLKEEYGNPSSTYSSGKNIKDEINKARNNIARILKTNPENIIFTSCGSESNVAAIMSSIKVDPNKKHIITTKVEHASIMEMMNYLEKQGYSITFLNVDNNGRLDLNELKESITADTCLISVMMANNEIGNIYPIKEIAKIAHDNGIIFHCDAVQAVGHIPIRTRSLGVDFLSLSAHKFGGPKGMGFLYVREGTMLHKLHFGGSQERGMRPGTENVNGIAGMAAAMRLSCSGYEEELTRLSGLRDMLIEGIKDSGLRYVLNSDPENSVPYILNVSFPGFRSSVTVVRADMEGICISAGAACSAGTVGESHVIKSMSRPKEVLSSAVRFSLGRQNTEKDMIRVAGFLKKLAASR